MDIKELKMEIKELNDIVAENSRKSDERIERMERMVEEIASMVNKKGQSK